MIKSDKSKNVSTQNKPDTRTTPPPKKRAIVFLAWGEKYINEMQQCIKESILPNYPIFLITDEDTKVNENDKRFQVLRVNFKLTGRRGHARCGELLDHIPKEFDTYLYLDVDTRILGDISLGFDKAEKYGMAMSQAAHYSLEYFRDYSEVMIKEGIKPRGQLIYGAGVIFFSLKLKVVKVLRTYRRLCAQYSDTPDAKWGDQPHLTMAMELNDLNPYTLSTGYNHRAFGEWISGEIRIWHSYKPVPDNVNDLDPVFPRCYSNREKKIVNVRSLNKRSD